MGVTGAMLPLKDREVGCCYVRSGRRVFNSSTMDAGDRLTRQSDSTIV